MIPLMIISNNILLIGRFFDRNYSKDKYTHNSTKVHHANFCHLSLSRYLLHFIKKNCKISLYRIHPDKNATGKYLTVVLMSVSFSNC